jgi:hypothetical protein
VRLEGLSQLKKIRLIGNRTRDLPALSIVPQTPTLLKSQRYEGVQFGNSRFRRGDCRVTYHDRCKTLYRAHGTPIIHVTVSRTGDIDIKVRRESPVPTGNRTHFKQLLECRFSESAIPLHEKNLSTFPYHLPFSSLLSEE